MSVWKSDETLLSICILNFSFKNDFVWEEISNIRHSVSSPDETPRSSWKILRCASYFQLSSRCFIWWWNTVSHVWYITSSMRRSVSSPDETPRKGLKIRRAEDCFSRISRCFIWWWNTVSNAWYYFSNKMILEGTIKDAKMSSFHLISKDSLSI